MKTLHSNRSRQQGSVLLVSLILSAIIGITLASYLVMTEAQNVSVVRSQTWNSAMALTEAGLEDGLAMINKRNGNFDQLESWTNSYSLSSDNWTALGNSVYYVRRYVSSNNWGRNYYDVYVTNLNNSPVVSSSGFAAWNHSYASRNTSPTYFADVNSPDVNKPETTARKIVVQTKKDPLFAVAMAALNKIDLNGNNISTDSFDSADPNHSINGLYPAGQISMINSNGDICTDATIIDSISIGNANIKGKAKTGPNGTVSVGPNGYVSEGVFNDFNVIFPSVTLPGDFSWGPIYNNVTVDGTTYSKAILYDGDYFFSGLTGSLYIGTNVNCRILMYGNVSLTGSHDEIRVANGADVKLYMAGSSFKVKGNGIVNMNGNATSFYYYGLPSNTSVDFGGNGGFTGAIYAPQADFSLGGGGSDTLDFIGASVTKSVTMNGHFGFHYDENLRKAGPGRGYIPVNWAETVANN